MNPLDMIMGQIANTVRNHASPNTPGPSYDHNPLLDAISGILGNQAQQQNQQFGGYRPDEDYSQHGGFDPGQLFGGLSGGGQGYGQDQGYGNQPQAPNLPPGVRPASEDPYGDPADQGAFSSQGVGNRGQQLPRGVRPASEDPYGDPADQGY